jgi:hypothetical protein
MRALLLTRNLRCNPKFADYMCRFGSATAKGTHSGQAAVYGECSGPPCEPALPTHVVCGFAATVANMSEPAGKEFSLACKADNTYIAVGENDAVPASAFAPLEQVPYGKVNGVDNVQAWNAKGVRTIVTALSPHPTKVMFYATINDAFADKKENYDIRSVGMIEFAVTAEAPTPKASMYLDLTASAVANRWNRLTPGPDGEAVYLSGVIRATGAAVYGRYLPGKDLEIKESVFEGQPTSIVGIFT